MATLPTLLRDLPGLGFGFLLVVARVGSAMLAGPGLGETEIPPSVRAALAVLVAALVYPLLRGALPPPPESVPALLGLLGLEILVGAWMGFLARALVLALSVAGGVISLMVGVSSVLQIDPALGAQAPALQRALGLAAIALLFASGLYLLPLRAILGSYTLIPPGGGFDTGGAAQLAARAVADGFGLGLRLAAPFVVTAFVWHAAMGFLSRLVPNIQVHVVSAPAQILSGLALLAAAAGVLFHSWSDATAAALAALPGL
jgi:flagellar biosynthetic protein FliR